MWCRFGMAALALIGEVFSSIFTRLLLLAAAGAASLAMPMPFPMSDSSSTCRP